MFKKSIMPVCAVVTCKNKSVFRNIARGGVSYHRFPRNSNVKEKWIFATGRQNWIPSKVATICSDHFEQRHFVQKAGERRYLNSLAVPSRNIHTIDNVRTSHFMKVAFQTSLGVKSTPVPTAPGVRSGYNTRTTLNSSFRHGDVSTSPALFTQDGEDPERRNEITSIEIEIMPENRVILRPQENRIKPDVNMNSQTSEDERNVIEVLRNKILEQDLLIRKLKVRNYRLKKRLFSLKSMEDTDS